MERRRDRTSHASAADNGTAISRVVTASASSWVTAETVAPLLNLNHHHLFPRTQQQNGSCQTIKPRLLTLFRFRRACYAHLEVSPFMLALQCHVRHMFRLIVTASPSVNVACRLIFLPLNGLNIGTFSSSSRPVQGMILTPTKLT